MSDGDRDEQPGDGTDPLEEHEDKGLGLTEEFARLEEEIRREVGADGEPAATEPAATEPGEGAAEPDAPRAAGEWTAPDQPGPGPDTGARRRHEA